MSFKITDPALLEALQASPGGLEFTDAEGKYLGTFVVGGLFRPPPGFTSFLSDEELEARRSEEAVELNLPEFFRDLEARG